MYREERLDVESTIDKYIKNGKLKKHRRVILFGAGQYSRSIIDILSSRNLYVSYILDNNLAKSHTYCKGVEIVSPNEVEDINDSDNRFILCSKYWREMKEQLIGLGIEGENIITIYLKTYGETLTDNIIDLYIGRRVYHKIRKLYPDHKILFCPYSGSGDTYLIGTFLGAYITKEQIDKYVFVVVSRACEKVASLFGIKNIYNLENMERCRALTKYYMACPDDCDMAIMNDSWEYIYTSPVESLRGLHGMSFTDMFRIFVFGLSPDCFPKHPHLPDRMDEISEIVKKHGIKKRKTVLLAPYADTLAEVSLDFWKTVAHKLQEKGYVVCTNLGNETEIKIDGTIGLHFPLDIAPQLVNWMGGFIGVRSGLCDIISGTDATKIVLYDKSNFFFQTSAFEYFSLRKMHLSNDVVEIQFDNRFPDAVLDDVLKEF